MSDRTSRAGTGIEALLAMAARGWLFPEPAGKATQVAFELISSAKG